MRLKLDVIGLVITDMAVTLAFYRRLGLEIPAEADFAPHAEVPLPGGLRLTFDTVDVMTSFDPEFTLAPGSASLAFLADSPQSVDETYQELMAAGYHGHLAPWDAFWGQRYAVVHDPDGHTVDLFAALPG
ncbi:MAG TPA: VOC family protein [Nakamurella sp.]|nr:VOC family protein [Nakamurella sp.]